MSTSDELDPRVQQYQEQLDALADENSLFRRKLVQNHQEFQLTRAHFVRQEQTLYSRDQELAEVRAELSAAQRSRREVEKAMALASQSHEREHEDWRAREAMLVDQLRETQARAAQLHEDAVMRHEAERMRETAERDQDAAVRESVELLRQARAAQAMALELERTVATTRHDLDRERTITRELVEQARAQQLRVAALEHEIMQLQRINKNLVEDCQSYEVLLQERTISGEIVQSSAIIYRGRGLHSHNGSIVTDVSDLAAELQRAASVEKPNSDQQLHRCPGGSVSGSTVRSSFSGNFGEDITVSRSKHLEQDAARLQAELQLLRDENRALSLYVNKILARLVDADQLENIVATDENAAGHRKTSSQSNGNKPGASGSPGSSGWRRHHSVAEGADVLSKRVLASETGAGATEDSEGGLLRKAFKRMSMAAWRNPATTATTAASESPESLVDHEVTLLNTEPAGIASPQTDTIADVSDATVALTDDGASTNDKIETTTTSNAASVQALIGDRG